MSRRRRTGRWFGLLLLAVLSAAWALAAYEPGAGSWLPVERRDLVIGVEVEGELEAVESAAIGPPQIPEMWNFKISFLVPEGTEVEAGQPVVGFDASQLEQELQSKIAEREAAEKELEKLLTDLENERRDKELQLAEAEARLRKASLKLEVPADVASRIELEEARIDHHLASLEIESLKRNLRHLAERSDAQVASLVERRDRAAARVERLEQQIDRMMVPAPRAGTVIYRGDWQGEKKKIGDSAWRAETVVEIPSLEEMIAIGEVDEDAAGRLAEGQPVSLRLDAYPDDSYRGTVRRIRRTVQRRSWRDPQKVVKVEIALESTDASRMRPGMRFRGTIEVERLENVLVVPEEAVFSRPGGAVVYVRTLFGRRQVKPTFGARNDRAFEVLAGLEEGSQVLRRGSARVEVEP
ncbi:MAG: HlyD family efflux transporter periplasmic adaptor subunit [Acidobacteria bacterium]|nr:MAG: HlyD family efflux transporter periplasmic adaptor subunit [Acidobacteriota bacterium]